MSLSGISTTGVPEVAELIAGGETKIAMSAQVVWRSTISVAIAHCAAASIIKNAVGFYLLLC